MSITEHQRKAFSERLNERLDQLGVPKRGRAGWLLDRWRQHTGEKLSVVAFRKWLNGGGMPSVARIGCLADILEMDYEHLMTGKAAGNEDGGKTEGDKDVFDYGQIMKLAKNPPIDPERLRKCIEDMDRIISKNSDAMPPEERAAMITALYIQRSAGGDDAIPADAATALAAFIAGTSLR